MWHVSTLSTADYDLKRMNRRINFGQYLTPDDLCKLGWANCQIKIPPIFLNAQFGANSPNLTPANITSLYGIYISVATDVKTTPECFWSPYLCTKIGNEIVRCAYKCSIANGQVICALLMACKNLSSTIVKSC